MIGSPQAPLVDVCIAIRAQHRGAIDAWTYDELSTAIDVLKRRLQHYTEGRDIMDALIYQMVMEALRIAEESKKRHEHEALKKFLTRM